MIRVSGVVVFPDGRREAFTGGAREWVAWEQYALSRGLPTAADDPRRAAGMTMTWFLAFRASTRGQKERPAFEAWLDLIDDVVDVEVGGADLPRRNRRAQPRRALCGYRHLPRELAEWDSRELATLIDVLSR